MVEKQNLIIVVVDGNVLVGLVDNGRLIKLARKEYILRYIKTLSNRPIAFWDDKINFIYSKGFGPHNPDFFWTGFVVVETAKLRYFHKILRGTEFESDDLDEWILYQHIRLMRMLPKMFIDKFADWDKERDTYCAMITTEYPRCCIKW